MAHRIRWQRVRLQLAFRATNARALVLLVLPLSGCWVLVPGPQANLGQRRAVPVQPARPRMSPAQLAMSHLEQAPVIANPLDGAVDTTEGRWIAGRDGEGGFTRSLAASIKSYTGDTLCVRFHSHHLATSDRPTHYNSGIEHAYHLYAPGALHMPEANEMSITAAQLTPVDFDARFDKTTYETQGDQVVEQHTYEVDEKFDVCFVRASRVLKSGASYALVEFRYRNGEPGFEYAWRFGAETAAR